MDAFRFSLSPRANPVTGLRKSYKKENELAEAVGAGASRTGNPLAIGVPIWDHLEPREIRERGKPNVVRGLGVFLGLVFQRAMNTPGRETGAPSAWATCGCRLYFRNDAGRV